MSFEVVSEAKTPFLSFLDDGGFEKNTRGSGSVEKIFKKGLKLGNEALSSTFCSKISSKISLKLFFFQLQTFFENFPDQTGPSRIFFGTAVI